MTINQLKCLKALKSGIKRREEISLDEYEIYCFLSDEGYANYSTARENDMQYNFFCISEKGKAFLVDSFKSRLEFTIIVLTFAITLIGFFINGGKQLFVKLFNFI